MAYEHMTYEVILQRMMTRITNQYPNLDNREGSILFNAVASAALELAIAYTELDNVRNESFVDTASREYILLGCRAVGMDIAQFSETAGMHKGEFNIEVPIGSRWSGELYNYTVSELIGLNSETNYYEYNLSCETTGTNPNNQTGDLTPITDMPDGLTHAKVTECLIEGKNETPDDDIRIAYYNYVGNSIGDGNVAQYEQWCNEYPNGGIGNAKIFPLWNGANTVKVSILSESNKKATPELIAEVQEYFDPNITGMGDGVAPIGSFVTVSTATEIPMNVTAAVTMKEGHTDTSKIDSALTNYFSTIAYASSKVPYMSVGAVILAVEGVESINNLTINGGSTDIALGDEDIPVIGTTNWVVS